jgi:hypothetical protein
MGDWGSGFMASVSSKRKTAKTPCGLDACKGCMDAGMYIRKRPWLQSNELTEDYQWNRVIPSRVNKE